MVPEQFQRIEQAEWTGALRFRLRFADRATGVADLAPELGDAPSVLAVIRDRLADVAVAQGARALLWLDCAGSEIDLDADALRLSLRAERGDAAAE